MHLPIAFEDRALVVIDKPAFLPTSGRTLEDPDCAQFHLARQLGEHVWAVHQLDATTTGLNVFVRRKSAVATFVHKLKTGSKEYLALASGVPEWTERAVSAPIGYDEARRTWAVRDDGRDAASEVALVATGTDACAVRVRIFTGRTHQVRLHLAHLGHPLVGDLRYGGPPLAERPPEQSRPMLHAWRLRLEGVPELRAPLPSDWRAAAAHRGLPEVPA